MILFILQMVQCNCTQAQTAECYLCEPNCKNLVSGLRMQHPHINMPLTLSQVNICSRHMNHKVTGNSNSVDSGAINLQFQGQVPFSQVQDDLMHSDLVLYQLLMQPPLFLPCLQHGGLLLLHLEDHAQQLLLLLQPIKEQCNQTLHHC